MRKGKGEREAERDIQTGRETDRQAERQTDRLPLLILKMAAHFNKEESGKFAQANWQIWIQNEVRHQFSLTAVITSQWKLTKIFV